MNKNYVKEYKGHEVPEGATHYCARQGIWQELFIKYVDGDVHLWNPKLNCGWFESENNRAPKHVVGLPLDKEYSNNKDDVPTIGSPYIVSFPEDRNVEGLSEKEISLEGEEVTIIANVVNSGGFKITVFEVEDKGVYCFSSEFFKPAKTQEQEDREAFIDKCEDVLKSAFTYVGFTT